MRVFVLAALAAAALAQPACGAEPDCKETLDGGWRCVETDGHVTERRRTADGDYRTTSTNPRDWGRGDGHGKGVTPPDSMIRNNPILRAQAWGRVTDPWEPRPRPAPVQGGWKAPAPR